jgi:alpha(1,3/1,4) fucosyltransferase
MNKIRIAFADFWPEWNVEDFITPILKKHYDVVNDKSHADVVFHSIFNRMSETPRFKCKKVLILAENWRPSMFKTDYSISFDPNSATNFRLPLWQMYWLLNPTLKDRLFERRRVENFERFCAFTVSNGSNMLRNNHFDIISQYKKVHAYGKVRTNTLELQRAAERSPFDSSGIGPKYWRDVKDEFFLKHNHKFMMAYENTSYPGYCTEKLMDAFLAGSIPIYWGDSKVEEDWNSKAFINAMKRHNWLDFIKTADQEQGFWEDIYFEPVFTTEQKARHLENLETFENWLIQIVNK